MVYGIVLPTYNVVLKELEVEELQQFFCLVFKGSTLF